MGISHLLEDFGSQGEGDPVSLTELSLEVVRLEAFENGYKAGWDDAAKAQDDDLKRISADFAGNLRDLSFTYHEACSGMLAALRPVLTGMVETVLPKLAHQTLGMRVIEDLEELARKGLSQPIEIVTAPANLEALETLVAAHDDLPAVVRAEPSLGEGQVHIRFGAAEHEVDLDSVLADIGSAMSGFVSQTQKESA